MTTLRLTKSVGVRLSAIVATIVFLGMVLISSAYIVQDFEATIVAERSRLHNAATAYAAASSAPLAERDKQAIFKVLRGIRDVPAATFISVRDQDGRPFAEMGTSIGLEGRDGIIDEKSLLSLALANTLIATADIRSGGVVVGTLAIHADVSSLRDRYAQKLLVFALVGFLAAAAIAIITNAVIRAMLRPLKQLSADLQSMGDDPDLSRRFDHASDDEIGVLASAFNGAFAEIEQRDKALRRHKDKLEETVDRRTRELRTAMEEAKRANAAKSDFLATMSHEIRTPMNGMMVMAELLAASPLAPRHQRYAEVISRSGNALLNIINDILDMSKIEAGKLELESIPFSIDTLMEDTISLFSSRAREKGLSLGLSIAPDVAKSHFGDPTRLGQIVANLVNNALKFTEKGGVLLKVTANPAAKRNIRIDVIDTGIGIAKDQLGKVFEAFSQADQTVTRQFGGTGLGLSISQRLANAMNGEITVESDVGKGTTFTLQIALLEDDTATKPVESHISLVVGMADMSSMSGRALSDALSMRGVKTVAVTADTDPESIDLLLVNAEDGKAFKSLRDRTLGDIPLVLLDGSGTGAFQIATQLEADAIVSLPLSRSKLETLIEAALGGDYTLLDEDRIEAGKTPSITGDFSALKVLAVDDNAVNREVLNEALVALKVNAVFATTGEEAVDLARKTAFDVIFMDCSMPGMDGYQATSLIREHENARDLVHSTIFALTAHVTGREAGRWKEAGMDGHIAKPFTVSQLLAALKTVAEPSDADNRDTGEDSVLKASDSLDLPLLNPDTLTMFQTISAANGTDMKARIFPMFINQVDDSVDAIRNAALEPGNLAETRDLLHALKSMASSSGALRTASLCGDLEEAARNRIAINDKHLALLQATTKETVAAMQAMLAEDNSPASLPAGQS